MFIIIEIQASNNGQVAIAPPVSYTEQALAEQKYHQILSYAAVSQVDIHTVVMLDAYGEKLKGETYYHGQQEEE